MATLMEEKYSLSVLLIVLGQLVFVPSFNFKLLISEGQCECLFCRQDGSNKRLGRNEVI